jgi:hypothetical protein
MVAADDDRVGRAWREQEGGAGGGGREAGGDDDDDDDDNDDDPFVIPQIFRAIEDAQALNQHRWALHLAKVLRGAASKDKSVSVDDDDADHHHEDDLEDDHNDDYHHGDLEDEEDEGMR